MKHIIDINAILKMSNFGEVGNPVWCSLCTIGCAPPDTFKLPEKYIYSIICEQLDEP